MSVSRLTHITQIGVEKMGELADRLQDPEVLRLENLEADLRPPFEPTCSFLCRVLDRHRKQL